MDGCRHNINSIRFLWGKNHTHTSPDNWSRHAARRPWDIDGYPFETSLRTMVLPRAVPPELQQQAIKASATTWWALPGVHHAWAEISGVMIADTIAAENWRFQSKST